MTETILNLSPEQEYKRCPRCRVIKPTTSFYVRSRNPQQRAAWCKACFRDHTIEAYQRLKAQVFNHYGRCCVCCGETEEAFLSIDHINNDGNIARQNGVASGANLYRLIVRRGFPADLQTLCMNCQWGKRKEGICPHQRTKS